MANKLRIILDLLSVIALALPALAILADAIGFTRGQTKSDDELTLGRTALMAFFILLINLIFICIYIVLNLLGVDILPGAFGEVILVSIFALAFVPLIWGVTQFF